MLKLQGQMTLVALYFATVCSLGVLMIGSFIYGNYPVGAESQEFVVDHLCGEVESSHSPGAEESFEEFVEEFPVEWGYFMSTAVLDAPKLGDQTYDITDVEDIIISHKLVYGGEESGQSQNISFRYMALLNEQPLQITETSDIYRDLTIVPNEITSLTFKLPPLDTGIYDFVLIALNRVNSAMDLADVNNGFAQRVTLIAGKPSINMDTRPSQNVSKADSIASRGNSVHLLLTLDNTLRVWNMPDPSLVVKQSEHFKFNIKAGYAYYGNPTNPLSQSADYSRFALLLFQNYQPVPLNGENFPLYIEVDNDTAYAELPVSLVAPDEPGRFDLLAIRIDNPGIPMCILLDAPDGQLYGNQVVSSRAVVDVVSSK